MVRIAIVLGSLFLFFGSAAAQSSTAALEAKSLFEQGVAQSEQAHWAEAAELFERSCRLVERPATVLNLVFVYEQLDDPIALVRSVQRLIAITDPERHLAERKRALEAEARAYPRIAQLRLALSPPEAVLTVDRGPPLHARDPHVVLLSEGEHVLTVVAPGYLPVSHTVRASAGTSAELTLQLARSDDTSATLPLALKLPTPPETLAPAAPPAARGQRRAARVLGALGAGVWLGGLASEVLALRRAHSVAELNPEEAGFTNATDGFIRARRAVIGSAWAGGILAATGVLVVPQERVHKAPRALTWISLGLGLGLAAAGAALAIPAPERIGSSGLFWPRSEAGMLLAAAALPMLAWPLTVVWK